MASLYASYLKERTDNLIIEVEEGFASYCFVEDGKTVYIVDIYVVPEARRYGHASILADTIAEIARKKGCTSMIGTVQPSTKGSTNSLRALLGYGMHLDSANNDVIVFRKEL